MCERTLTSLKYFSEEAPEYHVMAAGSLLGVAMNREKYSFPVGKVQMLTMYPMDLEEVLWAKGKQMLLNSYIADMTKYAKQSDTVRIFEAYDSLPAQLAKDAKKFQYKLIKSGARASQYGDAIDWLIRPGIVNKCMKCSQGFYPVAVYQDVSAFKLYYSDMGIVSARLGMTLEALQGKETEHFRGILTENYVAIALKTNERTLPLFEQFLLL